MPRSAKVKRPELSLHSAVAVVTLRRGGVTGKVLTVTRTSVQDFFLASISMIRSTSSPIAPSEIGALESISSSRERATKAGQYAAAIAALIAKAKLVGRWVERSEQKNSNVNYVMSDKPMTEEEWAERCVTEH